MAGLVWLTVTGAQMQAQTASVVDGFGPNPNGAITTVVVQPNGQILVGGFFTQFLPNGLSPVSRNYLARLNHDGSVDATFNPNPNGAVNLIALQPNGQIIIGGAFSSVQANGAASATTRNRIARLNADGSLDATFDPNASGSVYAAVVQPNGQIVIGGAFTTLQPDGAKTPTNRGRIARLNADGSLDTGFDPEANAAVLALALQPNGQIVVGGGFTTLQPNGALTPLNFSGIARLNASGTLDGSFGPDAAGSVDAIVLLSNGQILIGGNFTSLQPNGGNNVQIDALARLNADGTLDSSYIINPLATVSAIALQADGKVLIGGTFTSLFPVNNATSTSANYVARINTDGSLDTSFAPSPNAAVTAIAVQTDGSVILGGSFTALTPANSATASLNCIARVATDGSLDATLAPDTLGRVSATAVQANGQFLVGGTFTSIGGVTRNYLARLNANGSLDATFTPVLNGSVSALALQTDGKIIVGGSFTNVNGIARYYVARLNPDGTLDGIFNPNPNSTVGVILVQSTGQIILAGAFTGLTPDGSTTTTTRSYLARVNQDGTLDNSWDPEPNARVFALAAQSDGKLIVGGQFTSFPTYGGASSDGRNYIARLNTDGTLDTTGFNSNANGYVYAIALQSNGQAVIGGNFTTLAPVTAANPVGTIPTIVNRNHMARLNTDGTLDTSFDPAPSSSVLSLAIQANGQILVGGNFTSFEPNGATSGTLRSYLGRINTDGTLDSTFNPKANGSVGLVNLLTSSTALVGGAFTSLQGTSAASATAANHLAIINLDGSLNPSFTLGSGGAGAGQVNAVALQPNGQLLLGGSFPALGGAATSNLARFSSNGTADSTFVPNADGAVNAIAVLPNGASTSSATDYGAWLNSNGGLRYPLASSANGQITCAVQQSNGQILIGGLFSNLQGQAFSNLARLNADGSIDTTFNPSPNGQIYAIAIQANGQIVIGGNFTSVAGAALNYIARINANGSVDTSFNPDANSIVFTLAIQSNGQIIIGGNFNTLTPNAGTTVINRYDIARLNADGSVDSGFNPNPSGAVQAMSILANGQIVVGGSFSSFQPNATGSNITRYYVARLNSDGTLDNGFNPNANGSVTALVVQADGKTVIGGSFTSLQPNGTGANLTANYLARLNADGTLDASYVPNPNAAVSSLALQANGEVYAGGSFTSFNPNQGSVTVTRNYLALVTTAGSIDAGFDPNTNGTVSIIRPLADGSVIVGGSFTSIQAGGALLVGGSFANIGGSPAANLARLNVDGSDDTSFTANANGPVNAIAAQSDNRLIIAGAFTTLGGQSRNNLGRLNADGSLDTSFNPNANGPVTAAALQPNGQIIVGGSFTALGGQTATYLGRLNATGSPDGSFAPVLNGPVSAVVVQPNGQIVVGGAFTTVAGQARSNLARLNADGSIDASFNPGPNAAVAAVTLQTDGTLLIAGSFTSIGGQSVPYAARLTAAGAVDPSFAPVPNAPVNALGVQPDGKVVLGGAFTAIGSQTRFQFARVSATNAAVQTLTISANASVLTWTRSGGAPEIATALFEESTDGVNWTIVGTPARVGTSSNWVLGGLTTPASSNFFARARGITPSSRYGSSGLFETVTAFYLIASPVINTSAQVNGTIGTGFAYKIQASNLPTSYTATGLPAGLTLNASTGVISGTPTQTGTFPVTVTATNAGGTTTATLTLVVGATSSTIFTVAPTSASNRLVNLSTLTSLSGSQGFSVGFVITGTGNKSVLLRAVGPGLAAFSVVNPVATPTLQLFSNGTLIASNAGWGGSSALSSVFTQVGAFPLASGSADSALLTSLAPGAYSITVFDPSGRGGSVLAEVYDASSVPLTATQRLANLSSRNSVSPSFPVLTVGFIVSGTSTKSLLVRGVGPGLAAYGVSGALADPVLKVFNSSGTQIGFNAAWSTQSPATSYQASATAADLAAAAVNAGAFPLTAGSADSALLANLPPGTYTIEVLSASGGSGQALAEVYELR
jgi:uncharacterized delta-60 repeat protein